MSRRSTSSLVFATLALVVAPSAANSSDPLRPGDLVRFADLGAIVPPPGFGVAAHGIGPNRTTELSVSTASDGTVTVDHKTFTGVGSGETDDEGDLLAAPGQCVDDAYNLWDARPGMAGVQRMKWYPGDLPFTWWFTSGSTPSNLSVAETEDALRDASSAWPSVHNTCGMSDNISSNELSQSYAGRSPNAGVDINADGTCQGNTDGVNRVGFGTLPAAYVGLDCNWWSLNFTPAKILESDVRLNKATYTFWNTKSTCTGLKILTRAVMTHERGHTYGIDHVNEGTHGNLTMSENLNAYCKQPEYTLGEGDILGLRELYND